MVNEFSLNGELYRRYDNKYFVTNDGVVAIIEFDDNNNLKRYYRMSIEKTKFGHLRVKLNHSQFKMIHRMVFYCWGNESIDESKVIDHIDANPSNNHISNLRQITQKENIMYAKEHGNFGSNATKKIKVYDVKENKTTIYNSVKEFLISINAPNYMIKHNSISSINKRTEYKNRYKIIRLFEH